MFDTFSYFNVNLLTDSETAIILEFNKDIILFENLQKYFFLNSSLLCFVLIHFILGFNTLIKKTASYLDVRQGQPIEAQTAKCLKINHSNYKPVGWISAHSSINAA